MRVTSVLQRSVRADAARSRGAGIRTRAANASLPVLGYPECAQLRIAGAVHVLFNTGMNVEIAIGIAVVAADLVLLGLYGRRLRARR
jgi:hypothetical protein